MRKQAVRATRGPDCSHDQQGASKAAGALCGRRAPGYSIWLSAPWTRRGCRAGTDSPPLPEYPAGEQNHPFLPNQPTQDGVSDRGRGKRYSAPHRLQPRFWPTRSKGRRDCWADWGGSELPRLAPFVRMVRAGKGAMALRFNSPVTVPCQESTPPTRVGDSIEGRADRRRRKSLPPPRRFSPGASGDRCESPP